MMFTDPPYDLENLNLFKNIIPQIPETFIMCTDKQAVQIGYENFEYFKFFFTVKLKRAHVISNKLPMTQHDIIAYFRNGKTSFRNLRDHFTTHLETDKPRKKGAALHQKSVTLPAQFIAHYTKKNDFVLDIFGGTGTTLIACELLGRKCMIVELNPSRCQTIINRYEDLTKNEAIKL